MPKYKALLFAPLPPPVGGITSITALLHEKLAHRTDILFAQPEAKTLPGSGVSRAGRNIRRLLRSTLSVERGGTVLFFSSSRGSFWEKCAWTAIVIVLGRTAAVTMVAGDFPEAYAREPGLFRRASQWLMSRRSVRVLSQSPEWEARFRLIFPDATVERITAAVGPEFLAEPPLERRQRDPMNILFVGWIINDKGIHELLDAAAHIAAESGVGVQFSLVGPMFGEEEYWKMEAERRGVLPIVHFTGPLNDRASMLARYRAADIFVFPSQYEGFPVALLEAIAIGLPCVATDVGGVRDILDGGRAGMIVPPKDARALADATLEMLRDEELRSRLSNEAYRRARAVFTVDACIRSYVRALRVA